MNAREPRFSPLFIGAFRRFDRSFAGVAKVLSESELLKILEYLGKGAILFAVISWIYDCPQRHQTNIRVAWSVVDSRGGGRRDALEYLYENKVDLRGLYGEEGFFGNIDLHGANLVWANLNSSNFEEANLQNADLQNASLARANLSRANLTRAYLWCAYLNGTHLMGAELKDANLSSLSTTAITAILQSRTLMEDADLTGANLTNANLFGAVLTRATLDHAVLTGADLTDTDLTAADLKGAVLTGANLAGSDLSRASGLIQTQVDAAARGNWYTKLPAGIIAPKSWPTPTAPIRIVIPHAYSPRSQKQEPANGDHFGDHLPKSH